MINFEKIEELRKQRGMSVSGLCRLTSVSRTTYWAWRNKKQEPTNENIRQLAKALDVSVRAISDLQDLIPAAENMLADMIDSWLTLTEINDQNYQQDIENVLTTIKSLNNKLNQSVVIIKALLESMQTMFYIKDSNLRYLTANKAFLYNVGLPDDYHILNKNDTNIFSKNEAKKNYEQDRQVLTTGIPVLRVEEIIPGTSHKKWGLTSKFPVYDTKNKIVGVIGTFIDITDRKKAEERRVVLEKAIDSMGPSLTIYDCEKEKVIFLSKEKIENQTGYPAEKFMGRKGKAFYAENVLYSEDRDVFKKEFIVNNGNKSRTIEFRTVNSKGEVRSNVAVDSYINIAGKDYIVGFTTDATREKKIEEKQNVFEEYLNSADYGIGIINIELNKFTFVNKRFEELTGYRGNEFYLKNNCNKIWSLLFNDKESIIFKKKLRKSGDDKDLINLNIKAKSGNIQNCQVKIEKRKINEQNYLFVKFL